MHTATNSSKIDISKESETINLAQKFSTFLKKGDIVFLYGEIGIGKTTFIKHLVNSYQKVNKLKMTEVTSPTFGLLHEYEIQDLLIQHYDLFRLRNKSEARNTGLLENFKEVLTLVEWPEKVHKKPKNIIELFFEYSETLEKRYIAIKGIKENLDDIKIK